MMVHREHPVPRYTAVTGYEIEAKIRNAPELVFGHLLGFFEGNLVERIVGIALGFVVRKRLGEGDRLTLVETRVPQDLLYVDKILDIER